MRKSRGRGFEYKQCIVIRVDLGMSVGKLISQACHACLEASEEAKVKDPIVWRAWHGEGAKKVILRAGSLDELLDLKKRAEDLGLACRLIVDRGLTELEPGTVTTLGIGPAPSQEVDRVTGRLPLLK